MTSIRSSEVYCRSFAIAQSKLSHRVAPCRAWPQLALWLVSYAEPWQNFSIFSNNYAISCTLNVSTCSCESQFQIYECFPNAFGTYSALIAARILSAPIWRLPPDVWYHMTNDNLRASKLKCFRRNVMSNVNTNYAMNNKRYKKDKPEAIYPIFAWFHSW